LAHWKNRLYAVCHAPNSESSGFHDPNHAIEYLTVILGSTAMAVFPSFAQKRRNNLPFLI